MINDLYPTSDLRVKLIQLLQSVKSSDWQKTTDLNNSTVVALLANLLHAHDLTSSSKDFMSPITNLGGIKDKDSLQHSIETLNTELSTIPILNKRKTEISENYSYCWLLQQHVRQATNNQLLLAKNFYFPFLNQVMKSLPSHYFNFDEAIGTQVLIEIVGEAGGVWAIEKKPSAWQFTTIQNQAFTTTVYLDQQIAWLLFSNSLNVNEIGQYYQILGNRKLGNHFLSLRAKDFITS